MTRTPLKPIELHTLLALAEQPLHGYALVERIEELSSGKLRPLPGNLYVVLHRLAARGLLRERSESESEPADARRRVYGLTPRGEKLLRDELDRMARLLRTPSARALVGRGGGGAS